MKIALMIPAWNEELTIEKVVKEFSDQIEDMDIFVYDNNSTDQTALRARYAGATVRREFRQGKGNVVRTMFRDIEADIYVMVDGDDTYPADAVAELIRPIANGEADMVVGDRLSSGLYSHENKRRFHDFGNLLVRRLINLLFSTRLTDVMSGYRAFSRPFVKTIPVSSGGFEIETELTLHALDKKFPIKEVPIKYRDRPEGSVSKLSTFKDGYNVLVTILRIFKDYKPMRGCSKSSALVLFRQFDSSDKTPLLVVRGT